MTKKPRKPAKPAKPTRPAKRARPAATRASTAKQVAPAKKSQPAKPAAKFILFGADEYAKPRAATFSAEDPALLAKAADTMFLRLVQVTDPDVAQIAATLPAGRLHASGKGLVPYINGDCTTSCSVPRWPTRRRSQIQTPRHKTCRAPGTKSYPVIS